MRDQATSKTQSKKNRFTKPRLRALDAFRGMTVVFMILVNNPGSWSAMYSPLRHATWHGCTPTDLVFPFFLFATGNALAFMMHASHGWSNRQFWNRVVRRTVLIFLIGLLLNASPFFQWSKEGELVLKDYANLRIMGVLQRIALSFGCAAILIRYCSKGSSLRNIAWISAGLLLIYWFLCLFLTKAKDPLSLEGFPGTKIDLTLFGASHLYQGEGLPFDPEGLLSTIPCVAQVLIGWCVGQLILTNKIGFDLLGRLCTMAIYLLIVAYFWQFVYPLNKKIWTSSFTLWTSGLAIASLVVFIHLIDIFGVSQPKDSRLKRLSFNVVFSLVAFFEIFGRNPLFLFVLSGLLPRLLGLIRWETGVDSIGQPIRTTVLPWLYQTIFKPLSEDPRLGSLLYSIALLLLYAGIAWLMDKKKIYVRV
jgi:predicted acyltransferase